MIADLTSAFILQMCLCELNMKTFFYCSSDSGSEEELLFDKSLNTPERHPNQIENGEGQHAKSVSNNFASVFSSIHNLLRMGVYRNLLGGKPILII